jgi:hypothetical protein
METAMTNRAPEKDFGPIDKWREASGIYKLGFERESFIGFILPFVIVAVIGGALGLLIYFWL